MAVAPEQQRLLDAMAGTWLGEEELYPSPWDPKGGTAIGRTQARAGLDGQVITSDYAEERDGQIVFRGHGVYAWDQGSGAYRMYWFDSQTPCPLLLPATGTWQGDRLSFEMPSESADYRYVYDFQEPGFYVFTIELRPKGGTWAVFMRGEYVRQ